MRDSEPLLLYSNVTTGELLRRRWVLTVLDGAEQGQAQPIDHSPALLGAASSALLVLSDDTVSRYHAELEVFAEGVRLRDLDSTNGCFVGDERARDVFLEHGARFRVGHTSIRLDAHDEPAASEISTDPRGVPPGAVENTGGLLAVDPVSRSLLWLAARVAPSPSTVLLTGEHGVGKAMLARLLHDLSPRSKQPFVVCSARRVDAESLSSLFEQAKAGTLFIEEIGHLSAELQGRLLGALKRREVERGGDQKKIRIHASVIAASTHDLTRDVAFAPELLRRIGVVRIAVPSLSERQQDLPMLAEAFYRARYDDVLKLGPRALEVLTRAQLPGNLDQLRALITMLGSDAGEVSIDDRWRPGHTEVQLALLAAHVSDVIERRSGDISRAAQDLAMPALDLFRFCQAHDISID